VSSQLWAPSLASYFSSASWSVRAVLSGFRNDATAVWVSASSSAVNSGAHHVMNLAQLSSRVGNGTRGRWSSLPKVRVENSGLLFTLILGLRGCVLFVSSLCGTVKWSSPAVSRLAVLGCSYPVDLVDPWELDDERVPGAAGGIGELSCGSRLRSAVDDGFWDAIGLSAQVSRPRTGL